MNGILPLWKPKGMSSHDCVIAVRKLFRTKKVGHTGTLDPGAEGVLPICIGHATKVSPYMTHTDKTYVAQVSLGTSTTTEDSDGEVIKTADVSPFPSQQSFEDVLKSFRGNIRQIPPMYSAIKVKGKKLYEYARDNESVVRPERHAFIHKLEIVDYDPYEKHFWLKVVCSKGTYIRTLCTDIGNELGFPSHMSALYRTKTGIIEKEDTVTLDDIKEAVRFNKHDELLLSIGECLPHMPRISVEGQTQKRVYHGQKLTKPSSLPEKGPFLVMFRNKVIALYEIDPKNFQIIKPLRVFHDQ